MFQAKLVGTNEILRYFVVFVHEHEILKLTS
jgi:hypothetical protein